MSNRVALDVYPTPQKLADCIVKTVGPYLHGVGPCRIVEPSAGEGAFIKAIRSFEWWQKENPYISAVEIREEAVPTLQEAGANTVYNMSWEEVELPHEPDLIIGNPPFKLAQHHAELAMQRVKDRGYVAFLLRMNFLGSKSRIAFWSQPGFKYLFPIIPRPSFVGGGTDSQEYAMFVWQKGYNERPTILPPIVWKERKAGTATEVP